VAGNATLNVKVLVDAANAAAGLNKTADKFTDFAKKAGAAVAGAFAFDAIKGFVGDAVNAASDLEDAVGSVDAVFKGNAAQIHSWANDTSDSIRLPAAEFEKFAASLGSQLKNAGVPMDQLADKTKALIQLGADLGAQSGAGTAAGVDALKAALKGEYEQLENLNVNITAAQVSTEALALAHGDAALAADPLIRQQAALNLVYKQSGDAQGAAAREASNFAAQQESLNEAWTNFLAKVGGPLLGLFSPLLGAITAVLGPLADMIPIVVGLGEAISGVLLNPVILVGGAFAAWQAIGGIAGILLNLRVALLLAAGAVRTFFVAIGPVGWAILALAAGWEVFSRLMDKGPSQVETATKAIEDLGKAASEGGLTMARTKLFDDAKASGFGAALKAAGLDLQDYVDASSGVPGAQAELQASVNKSIDVLFDQGGAFQAIGADAKAAGIGTLEFLSAVETGDLTGITGRMQAYADEQARLTGNTQTGADIMNRWTEAIAGGQSVASALLNVTSSSAANQETLAKALGLTTEEMNGLKGASQGQIESTLRLAAMAEDLAGSYQKLGVNLQNAANATELNSALDATKGAAEKAGRAMDYVNQQIDQFTGRSASLDDATVDWNSKLRIDPDTTSSVATYVTTVDGAAGVLNDFNTAQLGQTKAGEEAYAQLRDLKGGYDDLNSAAYEAALKTGGTEAAFAALTAQSKTSREQFLTFAQPLRDAGVDVEALADKLGILDLTTLTPKFMEVVSKDENARAALAAFQAAKIDPKTVQITADDELTPAIESAITYVDQLSGESVTIPLGADPTDANAVLAAIIADIGAKHPELGIGANPTPAEGELNGLLQTINGAQGTATIDAQNRPAAGVLGSTVGTINNTTATLGIAANPGEANSTVNQTTGAVQANSAAILKIIGNTAPARNAVEAFISDTNARTASVTVTANTAPFYAAFNALPTSRAVTVTTTQVTVAAPAPAPALARTAFAAPSLARGASASPMLTASGSSGGDVNITVQGAIDPDATARQIQRLLTGRGRRSGGIIL